MKNLVGRIRFYFNTTFAGIVGFSAIFILVVFFRIVSAEKINLYGAVFTYLFFLAVIVFLVCLPYDIWRLSKIKKTCKNNNITLVEFQRMSMSEQKVLLEKE